MDAEMQRDLLSRTRRIKRADRTRVREGLITASEAQERAEVSAVNQLIEELQNEDTPDTDTSGASGELHDSDGN